VSCGCQDRGEDVGATRLHEVDPVAGDVVESNGGKHAV
jgi:hypothetical protein